jgi:hypothetical protein
MIGYDQRGKNSDEFGFFNLIQALFGGGSRLFHHHSDLTHFRPRSLLLSPLSTTFDHILRLNALLSMAKLQVSFGQFVSI